MSAAPHRRTPPELLDPLTSADRIADAWLAAQGDSPWRWPRLQGGQPSEGEDDRLDGQTSKQQVGLARPDLQLEAAETLIALRAGGLIDAAGRRTDAAAPPATCGDASDDAPALPVAVAASLLRRCLRTVQTRARRLCDAERRGQLVLPCVPAARDVYKARPSAHNEGASHGC